MPCSICAKNIQVTPSYRWILAPVGYDDKSLSGGTAPTKVGVFARRRQIDELKAKCVEQEARLKV
jgi:hypothetical protein